MAESAVEKHKVRLSSRSPTDEVAGDGTDPYQVICNIRQVQRHGEAQHYEYRTFDF